MCFNIRSEADAVLKALNDREEKSAYVSDLEKAVLDAAKNEPVQVPVVRVIELLLEQDLITGTKWSGYRLAKRQELKATG